MGACWSNQLKVASPSYPGANSRNPNGNGNNLSGHEGEVPESTDLKKFSFSELKSATRNFKQDCVLGEGGFGSVFKGWLDEHTLAPSRPGSGIVIAAKRLNREGFHGHQEWLAQITYLGKLHHPNLVKLIGYCEEDDHRFLVYEFMAGGSMDNHLFRNGSDVSPLPWSIRMKVALDAAKGLAFLHNAEQKDIYPCFQISNILLDSNYNAKLSDFGLPRESPTEILFDRVMEFETYGYGAPESVSTGHFTSRNDVYCFGVVLLEMVTGRRVIDKNRGAEERNLVNWARPYLADKHRVVFIMDASIQGQYSAKQAKKAANLIIQCLAINPRLRPNMDEVIKVLQQLQEQKEIDKRRRKQNKIK